MGDFQYPEEPNGRLLLFGSPWVVEWLARRAAEGLSTIDRVGIDATFKVGSSDF
jgi:hypothetical protein